MGKLQRKKPVGKKKKKKQGDSGTADAMSVSVTAGSQVSSISDAAGNKKKPAALFKKPAASARPAKVREGRIENTLQFLREVKIELKKVTWPTRAQAMGSTAVVIVLVLIISLYLGLVDGGLSSLVRMVLH